MALGDITTRFLDAVSWLINKKKAHDKKEIATNLGVSTSLMTEISKGRSNVGVLLLQNIVIKYSISAEWLLTGEGSMLKTETPLEDTSNNVLTPENGVLNTLMTPLLDRIDALTRENERLKIEVETLKNGSK